MTCLGQLRNAGAPEGLPIVCAQNSIVNEPYATRVFDNVYGVMLNMPAIFLTPGEVIHPITGNGGFIEVGNYPSGADELALNSSRPSERRASPQGQHHVMRTKAAKTLVNLNNALEAITDARATPRLQPRHEDRSRDRLEASRNRVGGLSRVRDASKAIRGTNKMPKATRGDDVKRSSTWQSMVSGTGNIEAEAINGDVVKLGRALGISCPYNETLWRVAENMAKNGEKPGRYTVEQLTQMATTRDEIFLYSIINSEK